MNPTDDNFSTPKQMKRLGLRRTSSILKTNSAKKLTGSNAKSKIIEIATPASTPRREIAQSDVKVDYKHLEQDDKSKSAKHVVTSPETPKNSGLADTQRLAVSTNCRPYRLALSKKVREKMTKKRLEFYLANEMEKEETELKEMLKDVKEGHNKETNSNETEMESVTERNFKTREELLQQINTARQELTSRQLHLNKVKDLQQAIDVWKAGFSSALLDLQQKIEPRLEIATLLNRLHIPQEMFKYIKD